MAKSSQRVPLKLTPKARLGIASIFLGMIILLSSKYLSAYSGTKVLQETVLATNPKEVRIERALHISPRYEPYRLLVNVTNENGGKSSYTKSDPYWYFATLSQGDNRIVTIGETTQITSEVSSQDTTDLGTFNHTDEGDYIFNLRVIPNAQNKNNINIHSVQFEIRSNTLPTRTLATIGFLVQGVGFGIVLLEGYNQRKIS